MNKPANESINVALFYGTQLRYVSKRRMRKLKKRGVAWREYNHIHNINGRPLFYSWLMPIPRCRETDACRVC